MELLTHVWVANDVCFLVHVTGSSAVQPALVQVAKPRQAWRASRSWDACAQGWFVLVLLLEIYLWLDLPRDV